MERKVGRRKGNARDQGIYEQDGIIKVRIFHHKKEYKYSPFTSWEEARKFVRKMRVEFEEQRFQPERYRKRQERVGPTFGEFAQTFLDRLPVRGLKRGSITNYCSTLSVHVIPTFSRLPLSDVTRTRIKDWVVKLRANPKLSYRRVQDILLTLSAVMTEAVEDGLIGVNPAARASKILGRPQDLQTALDEELEILTPEEERTMLDAARQFSRQLYTMLLLLLSTGMRIGELLGLHRTEIDFHGRFIKILRNFTDGVMTTPKYRSFRRVDLTPQVIEVLKAWLEVQDLDALQRGVPKSEIVFPAIGTKRGARGEYMRDGQFRIDLLYPLQERVGVRRMNPHACRHTYASRLLSAGVNPKYVQHQLGHKSIRTTMDTYSHLLPASPTDAVRPVDVLDRLRLDCSPNQ